MTTEAHDPKVFSVSTQQRQFKAQRAGTVDFFYDRSTATSWRGTT